MARELQAVGTVSYNGYTFPEAFDCKIRSQVIYDTADRARKYITYTITIECIVVSDDAPQAAAGAATDVNLADIRKRLQTPNKALVFTDQGFGSLSVDGDIVIDSKFGPKPLILAWEPVGSSLACRIVWVCEVTIPECSETTPQYHHAFAEFTYQNSWTINESGMTTRTMRATLEVPIDTTGNLINDTVDKYLEYFNPPVPDGFWRSRHRDESRGKNVLDITIIDTEIPSDNPYLQGTIKCDCRHRVYSSLENGFINWFNTIRGSFQAAPGVNRGQIWSLFQALVQARRNKGNNKIANIKGLANNPQPRTSTTLITNISVEESIFSREIDFEISWRVISLNLDQFLANNGFFTATETNWNLWKTSLGNVLDPRGIAQMESKASDDLIVDLCAFAYPPITSEVTKTPNTDAPSLYSNDCPPQESSYTKYETSFSIEYDHNTIQHQRLIEINEDSIRSASAYPDAAATGYELNLVTDNLSYSSSDAHKIQIRGGTRPKLIFRGRAERLCYPVTAPKIVSVGGKTVLQSYFMAHDYVKVVSDKVTIHGLIWEIEYYLNEVPEGKLEETIVTSGTPEHYSNNG